MSTPEPGIRVRPLAEIPALVERAAKLLRMPSALVQLSGDEAAVVASHMGLVTFAAGSQLMREGASSASGHMLLLLEGEVNVDTQSGTHLETVALSVLGAGDIIGELSLLDGAPRSATCTAMSAVQAAGLSRKALEQLLAEQPLVAAKLVVALATRIAERLRAVDQQVQMYAQLAAQQGEELNRLRRLLGDGTADGATLPAALA